MTFEEVQKLLPESYLAISREDGRVDIYDETLNRMAGSIVRGFVKIDNRHKVALCCHLDRPDLGLVLSGQPALTQ